MCSASAGVVSSSGPCCVGTVMAKTNRAPPSWHAPPPNASDSGPSPYSPWRPKVPGPVTSTPWIVPRQSIEPDRPSNCSVPRCGVNVRPGENVALPVHVQIATDGSPAWARPRGLRLPARITPRITLESRPLRTPLLPQELQDFCDEVLAVLEDATVPGVGVDRDPGV